MGLIVNVLREASSSDCSCNGVTRRYNKLCLTNVEGPFEPTDNCPAATLVHRDWLGAVHVAPAEGEGKSTMFGGNYVATSDSRFSAAIENMLGHRFYGAVAVHDRIEY